MTKKIILKIANVNQWFGDSQNPHRVLHDVSLDIMQGQFVALVGASGCGKSTLFRSILGTDLPKSGSIQTDGHEVSGPNRNVGVVYQKYGLYQFLTAQQNVAFGPMLDQSSPFERLFMPWSWWPKRRKHLEEARELLTKLKLQHALKSYPCELSGGMQQRVAIAQSLIMKPKILLLDEPFGALDEATREDLQKMLLHLYKENVDARKNGQEALWTVLLVTHELNEAFYVSDRVVGLSRNWYQDTPSGRVGGETLGATKVWDKCAPTFDPEGPKDFERFYNAKTELKRVVLNDKTPAVERGQHVSFWSDLENGVGTGVAIM
jgi:NitT/TauT family transport system ATP-binding protein